jgi:dihydrofolate synthase/folylpolyglutamate synthase
MSAISADSGVRTETPALDRIERLCTRLLGAHTTPPAPDVFARLLDAYCGGDPGLQIVKVAGTNGKGSVTAMLDACFRAAGLRTGTFTSPHMTRVTERVRLGGREIDAATLDRHAAALEDLFRWFVSPSGAGLPLSYFQVLAIVALDVFRANGVQWAVFEAGVGGASDPISRLPGSISVITSVAFDHEEQLGRTLTRIARDKAGIASPDSTLLLGPTIPPRLVRQIRGEAEARGVRVLRASRRNVRVLRAARDGSEVRVGPPGASVDVWLPLAGEHQVSNLALAAATVGEMVRAGGLPSTDSLAGVSDVRWEGRMETVPGTPRFLLDVAHNEEGVAALAAALDRLYPDERRILLLGCAQGKNFARHLPLVGQIANDVRVVDGFHRAVPRDDVADAVFPFTPVRRTYAGVDAALDDVETEGGDPLVVAAGSVFFVGAVRAELARRRGGR